MMPDLGKYAATVLAAYGSSLVLLIGLVWLTLHQGRRARRALKAIENRDSRDG